MDEDGARGVAGRILIVGLKIGKVAEAMRIACSKSLHRVRLVIHLAAVTLGAAVPVGAQSPGVVWRQSWAASEEAGGTLGMLPAGDGNFIVVAGYGTTAGASGFSVTKIGGTDGTVIWRSHVIGSKFPGVSSPRDFAVDAAGNIFVTGVGASKTSSHFLTARFLADGTLKWKKTLKGTGGSALALDGAGNPVVTGYAAAKPAGSAVTTIKYAAANGGVLWKANAVAARPGNPAGRISGLAVDPAGHVLLARSAAGSGSPASCMKYDAAKGALLWSREFIGEAGESFGLARLAVDPAGDIAVTGAYSAPSPYEREAIIKLSGTTGATLWERGGFTTGYLHHAEFDPAGHLVVIRQSGSLSNSTMSLMKLEGATGEGLWSTGSFGIHSPGSGFISAAIGETGGIAIAAAGWLGLLVNQFDADGRLVWQALDRNSDGLSPEIAFERESLRQKQVVFTPDGAAVAVHRTAFLASRHDFVRYTRPPPGELVLRDPAGVDWAPGTLFSLGEVPLRTTTVRQVTICNSGDGELLASDFSITDSGMLDMGQGPEFKLELGSEPRIIPPGASVGIGIVFRPNAGGNRTARLHLRTSDPDEKAVSLTLVARGIGAEQEFGDWAVARGLPADLPPDAASHADGIPNLLKFAFNLDPTRADFRIMERGSGVAGMPLVTVETRPGTPGTWFRFEFVRRRNTTLFCELGESFKPFTGYQITGFDDTSSEVIDGTWERVVGWYRVSGSTSRRFLRLFVDFKFPDLPR